ncbi:hypothetical protein SAMN05518849_101729 [Sphingobium sp. AP50]|uniref:hypothetical protein n=1 Tax=Sphingobium sp. AP50 TaxID=1884369 RepID=UPI0008CE27B1|nr:hypothetical protein [Sphingobium sp. AP50]SEI73654.1 hypothetical protein SAMN05518849_101729 [Sphingobium sp. AP50]
MKMVFALASLAIAAPATAGTVVIPFAPPVDHALVYRIEQHRPIAGKVSAFTATRDLRFERTGEGYSVTVTLRAIDTDAATAGAVPYRAALEPLVGIAMRFRLNDAGKIVAVDDLDAVWAKVQAGVDSMLVSGDSDRQRAAKNVQALFASLSPEGRLALLAGELQPLFLFAASDVEDGAGRGVRTVAGSPLVRPVPVEGALTLAKQDGNGLDLEEKLAGEGVQVAIRYHLSRVTGLVENQERSLIAGGQPLVESRSLTPAK